MNLSILIAAYNVESFIEKCIRSCYVKELSDNYEIIVVNDGSTDHTKQIVEDLSTSILNLKLVNQSNKGLGAARNTGIKEAKGDYLWMIDGDDYIENEAIKFILQNLNKSQIDVFALDYNIVDEKGKVLNINRIDNLYKEIYNGSEFYSIYFEKSYTWQYIFKKSIFLENNIYFKERINMQDSEIFPKIMFHSKVVKHLNLIAYNYVQQMNSFTNTDNPEKRYKYFESIIIVRNSLIEFSEKIKNDDKVLYSTLLKKIDALDRVVFHHLVFKKYDGKWLKKIIKLLKNNNLYPLQYSAKGKMKFVKLGMNNFPVLTKKIIDKIRETS